MSITKIAKELAPFLKYANKKNPSNVVSEWTRSENQIKGHFVYKNCVSCDTPRFTDAQIKTLSITKGTDTYFCKPCYTKVSAVTSKYSKGTPEENKAISEFMKKALFEKTEKVG
jgi:hypothetical protein